MVESFAHVIINQNLNFIFWLLFKAETRAYAQAQFQAHVNTNFEAYAEFQAQTQTRTWALTNNGTGFYNPFDYVMVQPSMEPFPFYGYNANMTMMSEPIYALSWKNHVQYLKRSSGPR